MSIRRFTKSTTIPAPAADLFDWHARPGAFERLSPPWERVAVKSRSGTIRDGDTVDLEVRLGPIPIRWRARHSDYVEGRQFRDVQEGGPFRLWKHVHRTIPDGDASVLEDDIEYELPLSPVSDLLAGPAVRTKINRMFAYRHRTTRDDLAAHAPYRDRPRLRVAITGASGLIGSTLAPFLTTAGHAVLPVTRHAGTPDALWRAERLAGSDATVHLAGEPIDGRWTEARKRSIRDSRVVGTKQLSEQLAALDRPPEVLVCASAIGYYGDRGDAVLPESAEKGSGFLSDVCADWEAATAAAVDAGIRVVYLRFGVVLSGRGGALSRMLLPFRLGLGGRVGPGDQFMSWIALDDAVGAIHAAIQEPSLSGAVNVTSPAPVTNRDFTRALGRVLARPTPFPLPASAARAVFGEMADALLLSSARCVPEQLEASGYRFRYPDLETALSYQLGRMPVSSDEPGSEQLR